MQSTYSESDDAPAVLLHPANALPVGSAGERTSGLLGCVIGAWR